MLEELRTGFRYVVGFPPVRVGAHAARDRQRDGDAVHGAHAGDRDERVSRRRAHARLPDDGVRARRRRRRALPRVATERARTRSRDGRVDVRVRRRPRRVLASFDRSGSRCCVLPIVGAGFMVQMAATNTILQTIVEEQLRGRVMAFYTMAFLGTAPIGSLFAGVAAARIGASTTIVARRRRLPCRRDLAGDSTADAP